MLTAVPALGLGLAAAAAVVAFVRPQASSITVRGETARVAVSSAPSSLTDGIDGVGSEPAPGASIESVEFGPSVGAIFMVAAGPEVTPVVWLTDDAEPTSG